MRLRRSPRTTVLSAFFAVVARFTTDAPRTAAHTPSHASLNSFGARRGDSATTGAAMATVGPSGARTQGGRIAALFGRLRTQHRALSGAASVVAVGVGALLLAPTSAFASPPTRNFDTQIAGSVPPNAPVQRPFDHEGYFALALDGEGNLWASHMAGRRRRFWHWCDRRVRLLRRLRLRDSCRSCRSPRRIHCSR